jgi:hypothetical protein
MSDYLGNLVARSLAPNAGVQPRIPSIFEPPPGPAFFEQPVDLETGSEIQISSPAPKTNAKAALTENTGQMMRADIGTSEPSPHHHNSENELPSRTDSLPEKFSNEPPPRAVPFIPTAIRPVAAPTLAAEERLSQAPSPQNRQSAKIESPAQGNVSPNAPPHDPDRSDAREKNAPTPLTRAASTDRHNFDSVAKEISIRPVRPAREANQFPTAPTARRDAVRLPTISNSAQPDSIQITIGRVEVRASTPAAAMPRARSKKEPAMSLETYLQRRAEGGRR